MGMRNWREMIFWFAMFSQALLTELLSKIILIMQRVHVC